MFIQVKLLNGFPEPLWYKIPAIMQSCAIGSIVQVPLRNRIESALVIRTQEQIPTISFIIKEIQGHETFPSDPHYMVFIEQLAHYYQIEPITLIKRIKQFLSQQATEKEIEIIENKTLAAVQLTLEQRNVCDFLFPFIKKPQFKPTVLHGVTGSGKTEVYKKLMLQAIENQKTTLLLLPEVSLALEFEQRLKKEFSDSIPFFSFHSATSTKNKKQLWQQLLDSKPIIIIGVHLPILMPIANLGLIIIDEEHEVGYQEKKHPKINTKEAALWRAKIAQIPVVLGSATPSLTTLYNVKTRSWNIFHLHQRFGGSFPQIKIVSLIEKKEYRKNFWITQELFQAISVCLQKKEQAIIFLNRRGFSFFVQCKNCSFVFSCLNCSVSMTLHKDNLLMCHYCGISCTQPTACSQCKVSGDSLLKKGIGTQQVVTILQTLFPQAHIGRADLDVTSKKKHWQQTVTDFSQGTLDILVGTQTITKGYHFPNVTLVGIIWADLNLHFPIYNAAETTLQQLIQVAGRAGRSHKASMVIVQTMVHHPIFSYINEIHYPEFYHHEIQTRQELNYPPSSRLVAIELKYKDAHIIDIESAKLAHHLRIHALHTEIQILGPTQPMVHTIKNIHCRKIYIKAPSMHKIYTLYATINPKQYQSSLFFTPNPLT
jgi:primosomal protein N' (replication factor Y)